MELFELLLTLLVHAAAAALAFLRYSMRRG